MGSSSPFIRLTSRADHLADVSPRATWVQQKQWCCLVGRQPTCSALSRHRARDARGYDHIYTTATAMHDNEYPPSPSPPHARVSFELLKCTGIQMKTGRVGGGKCPTVCTLGLSYPRPFNLTPTPPPPRPCHQSEDRHCFLACFDDTCSWASHGLSLGRSVVGCPWAVR